MKRPRLKKIAASILAAVMMLTSSPAAVFAEDMLDLSDTGIVTEVDSVTDLTEENVEFLPSGEEDLPEIKETPGQPEIPDPSPEETEPEFDPEQKISALVLGANSTAIQRTILLSFPVSGEMTDSVPVSFTGIIVCSLLISV